MCFFFFKQKTAYELRISDWSSDVCSSDLAFPPDQLVAAAFQAKDVGGRTNQPVPEKAFDVDEAQPLYVHRVAADEVPPPLHPLRRSLGERRGGKECVSTCMTVWSA